jgi:hypothetical protein
LHGTGEGAEHGAHLRRDVVQVQQPKPTAPNPLSPSGERVRVRGLEGSSQLRPSRNKF